eukprot:CAMPEP_0178489204 /NCGR_PEP_ID=MMETSP0696-20121128/10256_1 /TAXON_ID=265572 /ORGANISM="Extubocellulus spinifer, Strain CCMP396" /LENGTH=492 /DNA_ID=CAMNT_0020116999 /DNA_START=68 /DNA_END=1546 /DNA_ORIENTATION=-
MSVEITRFTGYSYDAMCKEGSLTAILAILVLSVLFLFRQLLHISTNRRDRKETDQCSLLCHPKRDGFLFTIEQTFIAPFVSDSLESFVAVIFFLWFILTVPMGITRYYDKYWAHEMLAQQGPLNLLAHFLGCKGLDMMAMKYTDVVSSPDEVENSTEGGLFGWKKSPKSVDPGLLSEPERNSPEELDPYFTAHLIAGLGWLFFGFVQIFWARKGWSTNTEVQHKIHRLFGYCVALPALFCHLFFASRMILRNPVNQVGVIKSLYISTVFESVLSCYIGIGYMRKAKRATDTTRKERLKQMHKVRMTFAYFQSIFGSGSIRIAAWILWVVGKFFGPEMQARIDRGACQTSACDRNQQLGSAEDCWVPVFLNLTLTTGIVLWLRWLLLCLPEFSSNKRELAALKGNAKSFCFLFVTFLLTVPFPSMDKYSQYIFGLWGSIIRLETFAHVLNDFAADKKKPRAQCTRLEATAQTVTKRLLLIEDEGDEDEHEHQD